MTALLLRLVSRLRHRLANSLDRLARTSADLAKRLEDPEPTSATGGPPEHWLAMVREAAPHLAEEAVQRAARRVAGKSSERSDSVGAEVPAPEPPRYPRPSVEARTPAPPPRPGSGSITPRAAGTAQQSPTAPPTIFPTNSDWGPGAPPLTAPEIDAVHPMPPTRPAPAPRALERRLTGLVSEVSGSLWRPVLGAAVAPRAVGKLAAEEAGAAKAGGAGPQWIDTEPASIRPPGPQVSGPTAGRSAIVPAQVWTAEEPSEGSWPALPPLESEPYRDDPITQRDRLERLAAEQQE